MSKYSDQMWDAYRQILAVTPTYENPNLDASRDSREVMIACSCHAKFIVWVNGVQPIPTEGLQQIREMVCKNCQRPIQDSAIAVSGHSAGVFNATMSVALGGVLFDKQYLVR